MQSGVSNIWRVFLSCSLNYYDITRCSPFLPAQKGYGPLGTLVAIWSIRLFLWPCNWHAWQPKRECFIHFTGTFVIYLVAKLKDRPRPFLAAEAVFENEQWTNLILFAQLLLFLWDAGVCNSIPSMLLEAQPDWVRKFTTKSWAEPEDFKTHQWFLVPWLKQLKRGLFAEHAGHLRGKKKKIRSQKVSKSCLTMDCNFAILVTMKKSWPEMTARSFTPTVGGAPRSTPFLYSRQASWRQTLIVTCDRDGCSKRQAWLCT